MPWTPQGPYSPGGAFSSGNANNMELQYTEATLSFNPDLFTGFVVSGLVATKDGVTPNLLDVTSGKAYVLQADGTTRQRTPTASTQTTSALSATYHLYLQPDGSWYWNTANTPATGSLFIAQVTTDGAGNISTVTDERQLYTTVFPTADRVGAFVLRAINSDSGNIFSTGNGALSINSTVVNTVGLVVYGANGQGARLISYQLHATSGQNADILDLARTVNQPQTFTLGIDSSNGLYLYDATLGAYVFSSAKGGSSGGITFMGNISGPVGGGIPTTRNGAATSVPIYTGTTTPSSPPAGAIWIKA